MAGRVYPYRVKAGGRYYEPGQEVPVYEEAPTAPKEKAEKPATARTRRKKSEAEK